MKYQVRYKHYREADWHEDGHVATASEALTAMCILRLLGMECVEVRKLFTGE